MHNYKILCDIGEEINFIIGGKASKVTFDELNAEENINRIYRIQFKKAPQKDYLTQALMVIKKNPNIALRFYGDYSENVIDWDSLFQIEKLSIDLWHTESLGCISNLKNLKSLSVTKNVSSKVSLSILEPLKNLEVLYTNISKDVESVGALKTLHNISFHEVKSNNLVFLRSLDNLNTLSLSLGSFKNFDGLTELKNLEKFHVVQVRGFDDNTTENVLANCNKIWALKLDFLKYITRLNFIEKMTALKYLSFEGVKNIKTYNPILQNKSLETVTGYQFQPLDKSLTGLKKLKTVGLGDSYNKAEIENFLLVSNADNITMRGKILRGAVQTYNPFYPL